MCQVDALLQELAEFVDREAGLANDAAERSGLQVPSAMHWHGHRPPGIIGVREDVVASYDAVDDEPGAEKRSHRIPSGDRGQPRTHAATVIFRIVGEASTGSPIP